MALTIRIATDIAALPSLQEQVTEFLQARQWDTSVTFQIEIALDELLTNVEKFAYGESSGERPFEVTVDSDDQALTLVVADEGGPFDPLTDSDEPDIDAALEDRAIGGLGIFLIRQFMDEVHYAREDGRNVLTMVKRRE